MTKTSEKRASTRFPTIQQIRRQYCLTSRSVATAANVEFHIEYLLEIGAFVEQGDALKILDALSTLTGKLYTLENVGGLCVSPTRIREEQSSQYS